MLHDWDQLDGGMIQQRTVHADGLEPGIHSHATALKGSQAAGAAHERRFTEGRAAAVGGGGGAGVAEAEPVAEPGGGGRLVRVRPLLRQPAARPRMALPLAAQQVLWSVQRRLHALDTIPVQ